MIAVNEFIVQIKKSHNDEVKLKGSGLVLKFDVQFNQGDHVNRIGTVVACPAKYETVIKEGYTVLIDKNLVTFQVHGDSLVNKSRYLIDEEKGLYRVPPNMIYLYKKTIHAEWVCPAPYLFIEPIESENIKSKGGLKIKAFDDYKGFKEQYGKVAFINPIAKQLGVEIGDTVIYKKDREYEFKIDEQILYHMDNEDVLAKVN